MRKRVKEFVTNRNATFWFILVVVIVALSAFIIYKPIGGGVQVLGDTEREASEAVSEFKITKQEGSRATNIIKGTVKNMDVSISDVTIEAKLYYAREVVAEETISLQDVKIFEEREFEIAFDSPPTWTAFKLEIK